MHSQFEEAPSRAPLSNTPSVTPPPNARLEGYLDCLCAPLSGHLSYEEQEAIRQELRTHLLAMVAAYEEIGSTPEVAIQEAIAHFGSPQEIGRSFVAVQKSRQFSFAQPLWSGMHTLLESSIGIVLYTLCELIATGQVAEWKTEVGLGLVLGGCLRYWIRRKKMSPLHAAKWTASLFVCLYVTFLTLDSGGSGGRLWEDIQRFILPVSVLGGVTGGLTALLQRAIRPFASPKRRTLPS